MGLCTLLIDRQDGRHYGLAPVGDVLVKAPIRERRFAMYRHGRLASPPAWLISSPVHR
jgi:hypothetical protein